MSASPKRLGSTFHYQSQCIAIDLSKRNRKSSPNVENQRAKDEVKSDEFYFSNMLRSMVSTNNSALDAGLKTWPYTIDPFVSKKLNLTAWPITTSSIGHGQSWFNYVGDWNRPSSSCDRTPLRLNHPKKRKIEKRIGGKINQLKLHHSSAFKAPTTPRNVENTLKNRRNNSNAINIRYVMNNIGRIYSLTRSHQVGNDSNKSLKTVANNNNCEETVKPPCKRFSALIGLEIVVDYVKRNDK